MKKWIDYKEFEILVEGKKSLGYSFAIARKADGWVLGEDYYPQGVLKDKKECIEEAKILVDDYYENTNDYED